MSDEPDWTEEPLNEPALQMDRKVLFLILAGMAGLAFTLALIQARMKRAVPTTLAAIPEGYDWEASLKHVADTFDFRLAGIDQRLDALANDKVAQTAASFSEPPTVLVNSAGGHQETVERIPPVLETGPTSEPPPPAAFSMPE